ncbi:NAD-dependent succinate-semialdehyde dehydrogenase [Zhihengliuella alba]
MISYAVTDPATGQRLTEYSAATDAEIADAIESAHRAYTGWGRTTELAERAGFARRAAQLFTEDKDELAQIIHREMGKPLEQSVAEVEFSADIITTFAERAEEWLADEPLTVADGLRTFVRTQPLGVILGIMPWNYPYYQVARFAIPNLILGNTVILKHAEQCPESSAVIARIFHEAGFPEDAFINLYASHEQISTIIADPRVQGVSLTGSERAGSIVGAQAGQHLKRCVLELGGSDPFLVLDTADVDFAVEQAVGMRLENTGQACNGTKRIIVMDKHYDEFAEKFTAAIREASYENGDFGPLSSEQATRRLTEQVEAAVREGAELVVGNNEPEGNVYTPGVLTGITPDMEVASQELFGPVAQLYRVSSDDEAIEIANGVPYGLGSIIICDDRERAERVGDQLECGMVFIGSAELEGPDVPFGGVKRSGFGREMGRLGMESFANKKIYRFAG